MNRVPSNSTMGPSKNMKLSLDALSLNSDGKPPARTQFGRILAFTACLVGALALGRLLVASELSLSVEALVNDARTSADPRAKWNDVPCAADERTPPVDENSRVLVTGGGGFIGAALMASLGGRRRSKPAVVVGLDSFNDYYAPAMKRGRAKRLKAEFGLDVVSGAVCNTSLVSALFEKFKAAFNSKKEQHDECLSLLAQLKVAMLSFGSLPPAMVATPTATQKQELALARALGRNGPALVGMGLGLLKAVTCTARGSASSANTTPRCGLEGPTIVLTVLPSAKWTWIPESNLSWPPCPAST